MQKAGEYMYAKRKTCETPCRVRSRRGISFLPLGRHTERTPTHTAVPPNPAVEPLPASLLNSFFCYELVISILST